MHLFNGVIGRPSEFTAKYPKECAIVNSLVRFFTAGASERKRSLWNNRLDPNFRLMRAVIAELNERVARIQFRKVSNNPARFLANIQTRNVEIVTSVDWEFYWKCIHNTFRVGDFWTHIDTLEIQRRCHACGVPETLEHIALECEAPGQILIWNLTNLLL